jgi:hypothetical protein
MSAESGIEKHLAGCRTEFERGDYEAFLDALRLCCLNSVPLPEWVYTLVIQQADDAFNHSTGRGRIGNWRNRLKQFQIDRYRANTIKTHLMFRHRFGRGYVSVLAKLEGYGKPSDKHPNENAVTLDDILKHLSKQSQGTPFRGSVGEWRASYKAETGRGRRKRQ